MLRSDGSNQGNGDAAVEFAAVVGPVFVAWFVAAETMAADKLLVDASLAEVVGHRIRSRVRQLHIMGVVAVVVGVGADQDASLGAGLLFESGDGLIQHSRLRFTEGGLFVSEQDVRDSEELNGAEPGLLDRFRGRRCGVGRGGIHEQGDSVRLFAVGRRRRVLGRRYYRRVGGGSPQAGFGLQCGHWQGEADDDRGQVEFRHRSFPRGGHYRGPSGADSFFIGHQPACFRSATANLP